MAEARDPVLLPVAAWGIKIRCRGAGNSQVKTWAEIRNKPSSVGNQAVLLDQACSQVESIFKQMYNTMGNDDSAFRGIKKWGPNLSRKAPPPPFLSWRPRSINSEFCVGESVPFGYSRGVCGEGKDEPKGPDLLGRAVAPPTQRVFLVLLCYHHPCIFVTPPLLVLTPLAPAAAGPGPRRRCARPSGVIP